VFSSNFPRWYWQLTGEDYRDVLWSQSSNSGSNLALTRCFS
jgi:hypothetical protein